MAEIIVTLGDFIEDFPEFAQCNTLLLTTNLRKAKMYISPENYGLLRDERRKLAIELMTAHLLVIHDRIIKNNQYQAAFITSASIHDVNVSLTPPPNSGQYEFWLNLTIYGTQLWGLLTSITPCGLYVAGTRQRVLP